MANISVTAADVKAVRIREASVGPAAETITAGQYVRFNTTTGKVELGNASTVAEARPGGIAVNGGVAGESIRFVRKGLIDLGDALGGLTYDDDVYLSATDGTLADATPKANEVQTITITGSPTGGTFTLTFDGQTTAGIAYNANAATIQSALEALSNIAPGDVTVGGSFTVTFGGAYAYLDVPAMTASGAGLTGGTSPGVTIGTTTPGVQEIIVGTVIPGWVDVTADKLLRVDL